MQIYLVGGAVRDELLGLVPKEQDWVVVGATAEQMLDRHYRRVGKDFPVFLHPETHEEYALARTERKVGPGHLGFDCDSSPDISLEQDLQRRDLTINAIARPAEGKLIDPCGGQEDLNKRVLRHVSDAFSEDPLRVLRVARFMARFAHLGFTVAEETLTLMTAMVKGGELQDLTPERVWSEMSRALAEPDPELFFRTLQQVGALKVLIPELADDARLTVFCNHLLRLHTLDAPLRFAGTFQLLSSEGLNRFCADYRVQRVWQDLAQQYQDQGHYLEDTAELTAPELLALFESLDAYRREDRFKDLLAVASCLAGDALSPGQDHLAVIVKAYEKTAKVRASDVSLRLQGVHIGQAIRALRLKLIEELLAR